MSGVISTDTMISCTVAVVQVILSVRTRQAIHRRVLHCTASSFVYLWDVRLQYTEQACPLASVATSGDERLKSNITDNHIGSPHLFQKEKNCIAMGTNEKWTTKIEDVLITDSDGEFTFSPVLSALG